MVCVFPHVAYLIVMFGSPIVTSPKRRAFYAKALVEEHGGVMPKAAFEYCSKIKFLGLPLINIRIGDRFDVLRKPVTGWIVCANYAVGGLFAFGGVAITRRSALSAAWCWGWFRSVALSPEFFRWAACR